MFDNVFERRLKTDNMLDARVYLMAMGFFIVGGLFLTAFMASISYNWETSWTLVIFALVVPIAGIFVSLGSNNWLVSLAGYLMVVIPLGLLIGPFVALYTTVSVMKVLVVTILVAGGISLAGVIYPKSVEHWGGFLLVGLLVLIAGDFARIFMPFFGAEPTALGLWDWIGVVLFSIFIFYDMNRAMRIPHTLDNAVDMAVALYLDIINLFLRLLAASGSRKKD